MILVGILTLIMSMSMSIHMTYWMFLRIKTLKKEETGNFCMDLSSSNSWKIHEGECHRKQSKNLNIQPL